MDHQRDRPDVSIQQLIIALGGGGVATSTWNPSDKHTNITLSGANLVATAATSGQGSVRGSQSRAASGNFYFETVITSARNECCLGIGTSSATISNPPGSNVNSAAWYVSGGTGYIYYNGGITAYGFAYAVNDVIGVHLSGGVLVFYQNGTGRGNARTGLSGNFFPMFGTAAGNTPGVVQTLNVAGPFTGGLPSGAAAWG